MLNICYAFFKTFVFKNKYFFDSTWRSVFWSIIYTLFNDKIEGYSYSNKKNLLLRNKIGIWDVLKLANRYGSLDSNIGKVELNDFQQFFEDYPNIRKIAFNGKKAAEYFKRLPNIPTNKEYYLLPSSSSANTRKTLKQKAEEWRLVL